MSLILPNYLVDIAGADYLAEPYAAVLLLSSYATDPTDETVSDLVASAAAGAGRVTLGSKTVTNEPISGWLVNQSDHAISDTTVTIDTGTGTPLPGDTFTLGASTQILGGQLCCKCHHLHTRRNRRRRRKCSCQLQNQWARPF